MTVFVDATMVQLDTLRVFVDLERYEVRLDQSCFRNPYENTLDKLLMCSDIFVL